MVENRMPPTTETNEPAGLPEHPEPDEPDLQLEPRGSAHGKGMWRIARDSGTLDLNSSYAYLLFSRDFGETCRVALEEDEVVGFILGYRRPTAPERLFIWQIAVDESVRQGRVGSRMLDELFASLQDVHFVETTITDDNVGSRRLFESFARRHGGEIAHSPLFRAEDFPDAHEPESLYVISGIG